MIRPKALRKNATIGIIAPASPQRDPQRLERGVRYLESLGYRVALGQYLHERHAGYLAGTDEQRVADIHAMFADDTVDAIFCARGGYGTPRLLDRIDYRLIRRHPKIFVGFSDITALQLALWKKLRFVTFSGALPSVDMADGFDPASEASFWDALTRTSRKHVPDIPESPLLPANLSMLCSLLGTPYLPSLRNAVLVLEDIGEETYRIDRMLTQLRLATIRQRPAALVFGSWSQKGLGEGAALSRQGAPTTRPVAEVLAEVRGWFDGPIVQDYPYGHEARKNTLPVGMPARVSKQGLLEIGGSGVV